RALAHRDPGVTYVLGDWTETDIGDDGAGLVFFDDHVSQARRVREAWARGFRWLLFDDNLAAHQLFATGAPPVPTVAMLFDDELRPGERIEWRRKGRHHVHVVDAEAMAEARALIADWAVAPELLPITCYRGQFGLTLVRLAG